MGLTFSSFASGSSGNCYLVKSDSSVILIDVGISGKKILENIRGSRLEPEDIDGILLTHEHSDHVKSIRMIGKKAINAEVYGTLGTIREIGDEKLPKNRWSVLPKNEEFPIGDIAVKSFSLSHDAAEPVGFTLRNEDRKITIVTDTGIITEEIFSEMLQANLLVLEANHEVNILRMGRYPYSLQQRILSDRGHLSNETAGKIICRLLDEKKRNRKFDLSDGGKKEEDITRIFLAHLSGENNTPEHAYLTVKNILFEGDYFVDRDVKLQVLSRKEPSGFFKV